MWFLHISVIYMVFDFCLSHSTRFQFDDTHHQFCLAIQKGNIMMLSRTMTRHYYLSAITDQVNQYYKYLIAILYYFMVVYLNVLFYIVSKTENFYIRVVRSVILVTIVILLFRLTQSCSLITKNAHKIRNHLQSYLVKTNPKVRLKLKIASFLERLDSKPIGFYCYEFFPMNPFRFLKYIISIVCNYFIISEVIAKM